MTKSEVLKKLHETKERVLDLERVAAQLKKQFYEATEDAETAQGAASTAQAEAATLRKALTAAQGQLLGLVGLLSDIALNQSIALNKRERVIYQPAAQIGPGPEQPKHPTMKGPLGQSFLEQVGPREKRE